MYGRLRSQTIGQGVAIALVLLFVAFQVAVTWLHGMKLLTPFTVNE
jgi:hypothetical protein